MCLPSSSPRTAAGMKAISRFMAKRRCDGSLASPLTAVVDLWDVALALAPAPGAAARAYAREALVAAAGTRLDPWLAGRFLSLVSGPGAPP